MKRQARRFIQISIVALLAIAVILAWKYRWSTLPDYAACGQIELPTRILTKQQYDAIIGSHPRPFIVEIATKDGALVLYGAEHTKDPSHPQIHDIRRRWGAFRPTVALCEGRLGFFIGGLSPGVKQFGESGAVFALARDEGIPTYTWEPPRQRMIAHLLEANERERVALFLVLTPYFSNFRHGKPADPAAAARKYIRKRLKGTGLEDQITTVADIDRMWRRDFPGEKDWRDTTDQFGLPGYFGEIAARFNAYRDEHFARVVIELVHKGDRVFAVAGSSHAVKLDPALRAALEGR